MTALEIVAVIGIVLYVIVRQLMGEPIRGKRLLVLPAVLVLVGALDLGKGGRHPGASDIVLIVIGVLVAAGIGVWQGLWMHLESRDGSLWGQLPRRSIWLWVALYGSRGALLLVAHAVGAHVAGGTSADLLTLGVNRLAQAAVVAPRALASGIPFAPEKDGSRLLAGAFPPQGGSGAAGPTAGGPGLRPAGRGRRMDRRAARSSRHRR